MQEELAIESMAVPASDQNAYDGRWVLSRLVVTGPVLTGNRGHVSNSRKQIGEENMRRSALAGVLFCLVVSAHAFAQSTNATVSGTVQDATGAVLPGVEIVAKNNGTGVVSNALSNESGAYSFTTLPPGVYTVSATLPGFQ